MSEKDPIQSPTERTEQRKSRRTLLLVGAVCIAPFVGSWLLYLFWQPAGRINYGDLIEGALVPVGALATAAAGKPFDFSQVRGRWVFVTMDSGTCNDACQGKLWKMRQVRLTQGKYLERIERVFLTNDAATVPEAIAKEYDGTWWAAARDSAQLKAFPHSGVQSDHIYLVDPLGNVVLRFPKDADPSRMKKDLQRLLRVSRIG